jgi:hypothetical protein
MKSILLFVFTGACVMDPIWGQDATRRDPIDFDGTASKPSATLRIQAYSYAISDFETLATFVGGTQQLASSPNLFAWNRIGVTIPDRLWVPGGDCTQNGMADLRVQEMNTDGTFTSLATFDAAGKQCLSDHLAAGEHPVTAGNACKLADRTIVLFAPPQCVPARTVDPTPPKVTIRLSNTASAWHAADGEADVNVTFIPHALSLDAHAMVRDPDGTASRVQLAGNVNVICHRNSDGATLTFPSPLNAVATQATSNGVVAQIGLDASHAIDVPGLVANVCPAGSTFVRGDGAVSASGSNAAGTTVSSPTIHFTI